MPDLATKVTEATDALKAAAPFRPEIAVILGTGLGQLVQHVAEPVHVSYRNVPHIPEPTVATHEGQFIFGRLAGKKALVMHGRFHRYEGYSLEQVTLPVRVFRALGAGTMIVSNAAGGMNPTYRLGDIVIIEDHINLMGDNPLIGVNDERLGPRFPDMSQPYDRQLIALAQDIALEAGIRTQTGVYVAVTGPNLETRAEYRFLRGIGADIVGMSTVPEVVVAAQCGLRVLGLSVVTDLCLPDALEPADIRKIIAVASRAEPHLTQLVLRVMERM